MQPGNENIWTASTHNTILRMKPCMNNKTKLTLLLDKRFGSLEYMLIKGDVLFGTHSNSKPLYHMLLWI